MRSAFTAPRINLLSLPEPERERANIITMLLGGLDAECQSFRGAVQLFEFSRDEMLKLMRDDGPRSEIDKFHAWTFIAARDAAGSVFRLYEEMGAIGANLNHCPILRDKIDVSKKRAATKTFKRLFSDVEGMRHSAQHSFGKIYGTPDQQTEHVPKNANLYVNNLTNDQFETTYRKRRISLRIHADTAASMTQVRDLYWAAFDSLNIWRSSLLAGLGQASQNTPRDGSE